METMNDKVGIRHLRSPFNFLDRAVHYADAGKSILDLLKEVPDLKFPIMVLYEGVPVSQPFYETITPKAGEFITVYKVMEGDLKNETRGIVRSLSTSVSGLGVTALGAAGVFGAVGTFAATMATAGIGLAVTLGVGYLVSQLIPDKPDDRLPEYQPSYNWNPNTTKIQGLVIPRYYGLCKAWGNIISEFNHVVSDANPVQHQLDLVLSYGIGPIKEIMVDTLLINGKSYSGGQVSAAKPALIRLGSLRQIPVGAGLGEDSIGAFASATEIDENNTLKIRDEEAMQFGVVQTYKDDGGHDTGYPSFPKGGIVINADTVEPGTEFKIDLHFPNGISGTPKKQDPGHKGSYANKGDAVVYTDADTVGLATAQVISLILGAFTGSIGFAIGEGLIFGYVAIKNWLDSSGEAQPVSYVIGDTSKNKSKLFVVDPGAGLDNDYAVHAIPIMVRLACFKKENGIDKCFKEIAFTHHPINEHVTPAMSLSESTDNEPITTIGYEYDYKGSQILFPNGAPIREQAVAHALMQKVHDDLFAGGTGDDAVYHHGQSVTHYEEFDTWNISVHADAPVGYLAFRDEQRRFCQKETMWRTKTPDPNWLSNAERDFKASSASPVVLTSVITRTEEKVAGDVANAFTAFFGWVTGTDTSKIDWTKKTHTIRYSELTRKSVIGPVWCAIATDPNGLIKGAVPAITGCGFTSDLTSDDRYGSYYGYNLPINRYSWHSKYVNKYGESEVQLANPPTLTKRVINPKSSLFIPLMDKEELFKNTQVKNIEPDNKKPAQYGVKPLFNTWEYYHENHPAYDKSTNTLTLKGMLPAEDDPLNPISGYKLYITPLYPTYGEAWDRRKNKNQQADGSAGVFNVTDKIRVYLPDDLITTPDSYPRAGNTTNRIGKSLPPNVRMYQESFEIKTLGMVSRGFQSHPRHVLLGLHFEASDEVSGDIKTEVFLIGAILKVGPTSLPEAPLDIFNTHYTISENMTAQGNTNCAWVAYDILVQPVLDYVEAKDKVEGVRYFQVGTRYYYHVHNNPDTLRPDDPVLAYNGIHPSIIKEEMFVAWAEYCIKMKFTFNGSFEEEKTVWECFVQVCKLGRAIPVWFGSKLGVILDRKALPSQLFNSANTVKNSFSVSYVDALNKVNAIELDFNEYSDASLLQDKKSQERTTVVIATDTARSHYSSFAEVQKKFKITPIAFYANTFSPEKVTQVSALGLINRTDVVRYGTLKLAQSQLLSKIIKFKAGLDALGCVVGDVVIIQSDVTNWSYGGRLVGAEFKVQIDNTSQLYDHLILDRKIDKNLLYIENDSGDLVLRNDVRLYLRTSDDRIIVKGLKALGNTTLPDSYIQDGIVASDGEGAYQVKLWVVEPFTMPTAWGLAHGKNANDWNGTVYRYQPDKPFYTINSGGVFYNWDEIPENLIGSGQNQFSSKSEYLKNRYTRDEAELLNAGGWVPDSTSRRAYKIIKPPKVTSGTARKYIFGWMLDIQNQVWSGYNIAWDPAIVFGLFCDSTNPDLRYSRFYSGPDLMGGQWQTSPVYQSGNTSVLEAYDNAYDRRKPEPNEPYINNGGWLANLNLPPPNDYLTIGSDGWKITPHTVKDGLESEWIEYGISTNIHRESWLGRFRSHVAGLGAWHLSVEFQSETVASEWYVDTFADIGKGAWSHGISGGSLAVSGKVLYIESPANLSTSGVGLDPSAQYEAEHRINIVDKNQNDTVLPHSKMYFPYFPTTNYNSADTDPEHPEKWWRQLNWYGFTRSTKVAPDETQDVPEMGPIADEDNNHTAVELFPASLASTGRNYTFIVPSNHANAGYQGITVTGTLSSKSGGNAYFSIPQIGAITVPDTVLVSPENREEVRYPYRPQRGDPWVMVIDKPQLFRILEITANNNLEFDITAVEYNEQVYDSETPT